MSLYEATWSDAPSILLTASNTGEALRYISQEFGQGALFQLEDLVELQPDNFILVRRCGTFHHQLMPIPMKFCPYSLHRAFIVRHISSGQQAAFAVHQLQELPALVLWHFELLKEEECIQHAKTKEAWEQKAKQFTIHELNTEESGILLIYNYCCCPPSDNMTVPKLHLKNHVD